MQVKPLIRAKNMKGIEFISLIFSFQKTHARQRSLFSRLRTDFCIHTARVHVSRTKLYDVYPWS